MPDAAALGDVLPRAARGDVVVDERVRRVGDAAPGAAHAPAEGDVLPEVLRCDPGARKRSGPATTPSPRAPAASNAAE